MAGNNRLDTELTSISTRCWKTSKARFEASRRMRRCSNASTLCVAMLSVEIIVINLLIYIPSLQLDGNIVTVLTVCLSAFVLVLSLIISQLKYDRKEEEYHLCGMKLGALEKKINIYIASEQGITFETVSEFNNEYQNIIRESNLNHAEMDWIYALRNEEDTTKKCKHPDWRRRCIELKWWLFRSPSIYHLLTVSGAIVVILVMCFAKDKNQTSIDTRQEITTYLHSS